MVVGGGDPLVRGESALVGLGSPHKGQMFGG